MIKILDLSLSVQEKKTRGIIESALELSGLFYSLSAKTPCDIVFAGGGRKGLFKSKLEIGTEKYSELANLFSDRKITEGFTLEDMAEDLVLKIKAVFPDRAFFISRWPAGAPYAVSPTHDVDRTRFFSSTNFIRNLLKKNHSYSLSDAVKFFLSPEKDPYFCIEKLCASENAIGIRSTFFFLAVKRDEHGRRYDISKMRDTVRDISGGGWEPALHASIESKSKPKKLVRERKKVEKAAGQKITGIRYHYLLEDENILYDADLSGFGYDSSIAHPSRWELKRPSCSYYMPWHKGVERYLRIIEFPVTVTDMALLAGQEYATDYIEFLKKRKGVLNLLWHQRLFSEMYSDSLKKIYFEIIEDAKKDRAWIAPLGQIADFIEAKRALRACPGGKIFRAGSGLMNAEIYVAKASCALKVIGRGNVQRKSENRYGVSLYEGDEIVFCT
ncbi:hypothetical protein JW890_03470 [candidate division WOR-3 bacterium]|nr:hypothetical protein [candidate division WOR-3 bacterium]